jgi:hypothetical protein
MSLTREEYEAVLQSGFYAAVFPQNDKNFKISLLTNDKSAIDAISTDYQRALERINYYLTEWDNAADQAAKDAVVGNTVFDLGSASVDPEDTYLWPPDGHFGNLYGEGGEIATKSYSALVDATSTGNTLIATVPSGYRFVPLITAYTLMDVAGLALVSTCSIGTNTSSYNNIQGATLLTGLSTQYQRTGIPLTGIITTADPEDEIYCRVSIASTASTYDLLVSVLGILNAE